MQFPEGLENTHFTMFVSSGLLALWPLRSVLTVIRDFRGTKDLFASPMYVGMQDGQSPQNSDQTNKHL